MEFNMKILKKAIKTLIIDECINRIFNSILINFKYKSNLNRAVYELLTKQITTLIILQRDKTSEIKSLSIKNPRISSDYYNKIITINVSSGNMEISSRSDPSYINGPPREIKIESKHIDERDFVEMFPGYFYLTPKEIEISIDYSYYVNQNRTAI